jgi:hypothetical protein
MVSFKGRTVLGTWYPAVVADRKTLGHSFRAALARFPPAPSHAKRTDKAETSAATAIGAMSHWRGALTVAARRRTRLRPLPAYSCKGLLLDVMMHDMMLRRIACEGSISMRPAGRHHQIAVTELNLISVRAVGRECKPCIGNAHAARVALPQLCRTRRKLYRT